MPGRHESERDFTLKSSIRAVLWAQGYSTRLDVLLAYDKDIQGKIGAGKAGLTDLDVLGLRLDLGFRVHTVVADCKTTPGQVPERLFWLSGVGKFFGSDANLLVRSHPLSGHAPPLAKSLDIALVGPDDLSILMNTYVGPLSRSQPQAWQDFFSPALLSEALARLSRLPSSLVKVERYRETGYWMEEPYQRLNRVIAALDLMAKEGSNGPTFHLVFADFVWLYVIALWEACQTLSANGLSKLEKSLAMYISGDVAGWQELQRLKRTYEALVHHIHESISLPLLPAYFKNLLEVLARCVRRPNAVAKMARRAEWLVIGQMVGNLGVPPWEFSDDDLISSKLLGDVAKFMVQASGLKSSFLDAYLELLEDWKTVPADPERPNISLDSSADNEVQEREASVSDMQTRQLDLSDLEVNNSTEELQ